VDNKQEIMAQIHNLLNPKSIAIVGVPRRMNAGKIFLVALKEQGFPGRIYPVHPEAQEIDGFKAYPTVTAIPGPVDLAIIQVPIHSTLEVVRECAAKGVKGAVLYTAGYKETGTDKGKEEEEELARFARSSGMRIIGPNCMGFYVPKTGLSFFPQLSRDPGPVSIITHSGSLGNILCRIGPSKGLRFSKAVSLGNECDLSSADFLAYLGNDPETTVIGAYLEGIRKGPYFLEALKEASLEKPVILWKSGLTPEGSKAAASHTGALKGSREIWGGVIQQTGAIPVEGFGVWVDTMMAFSMLPSRVGDRMAIISGPGGLAVSTAEACGRAWLRLAEISPQTKEALAEFIPPTGTSLHNPIDVGLTASFDVNMYYEAARIVAADPGVDTIVVVGTGIDPETNRLFTEKIIQIKNETKTPFVMVSIPGFDPTLAQTFCQAGIPFYETAEQAMNAYARVLRYHLWRQERDL